MFEQLMKQRVELTRGDKVWELKVSDQGAAVYARLPFAAQEGDELRRPGDDETYYVGKVERHSAGEYGKLTVLSESEWRRRNAPPASSVVWNIGSAQAVAGHSIHGGVHQTNTTSITVLLEALAKAVEDEPTTPPERKAGLIARLRELAHDPLVVAEAPSVLEALFKLAGG